MFSFVAKNGEKYLLKEHNNLGRNLAWYLQQ